MIAFNYKSNDIINAIKMCPYFLYIFPGFPDYYQKITTTIYQLNPKFQQKKKKAFCHFMIGVRFLVVKLLTDRHKKKLNIIRTSTIHHSAQYLELPFNNTITSKFYLCH